MGVFKHARRNEMYLSRTNINVYFFHNQSTCFNSLHMLKYIPTCRIIQVILCCYTFVKLWKIISGEETETLIVSLGQEQRQNPAQPEQSSAQVKLAEL